MSNKTQCNIEKETAERNGEQKLMTFIFDQLHSTINGVSLSNFFVGHNSIELNAVCSGENK
jgi:hypothetical protein